MTKLAEKMVVPRICQIEVAGDIIDEAADVLERRGWRRGGAQEGGDCPVCISEALILAHQWALLRTRNYTYETIRHGHALAIDLVYQAVNQAYPEHCKGANRMLGLPIEDRVASQRLRLLEWNDTAVKDGGEVFDVLEAVRDHISWMWKQEGSRGDA